LIEIIPGRVEGEVFSTQIALCENKKTSPNKVSLPNNRTQAVWEKRPVYGQEQIRHLRCKSCGREFSERKGTALWNCKISEAKAIAIAEQLSEGSSKAATQRLVKECRESAELTPN